MNHKDPYEILGVAKKASQDEIKRVYRRLAKQHHPDRNPGDKNAETRFKEIQAAYEVLGDSQRRAQYDQFGAGGPRPDFRNWSAGQNPFGGAEGFDFGSVDGLGGIFEQFFNRSGSRGRRTRPAPRRARPRGANLEYVVELTFEEMTRGAKREVQLSIRSTAPSSESSFAFRPASPTARKSASKTRDMTDRAGAATC